MFSVVHFQDRSVAIDQEWSVIGMVVRALKPSCPMAPIGSGLEDSS